jgi:3-oxoacyl-[acyl-carrier protein] reductase
MFYPKCNIVNAKLLKLRFIYIVNPFLIFKQIKNQNMNLDLTGKNALVCGSSKGIGKAAAIELAELGANVTLVARSASIMAELISELSHTKGQQHDFLKADFSDSADLKKKVSGLTARKTIHILVNNTGGPPAGPILSAVPDEFVNAFHNHLICGHLLAQAVVPGMRKAGYGRIINVISTSVKSPLDNLGVSNTIRAAVANWSKTLANEVGPFGITVNNLLPGYTNTGRLGSLITGWAEKKNKSEDAIQEEMKQNVPLRRFGEPREIGSVIAFLATPAAGYISGTNITVDGGRTKML